MAAGAGEQPGLAEAVHHVADHATALAKLQARLAVQEIRQKVVSVGIGAGLLVCAAFFGLVALTIGIAAGVAALALVLPVWASLLIVGGGLLLLSGLLGLIGVGLVRRGSPPVPEQAIAEAKLTTEALRNGRH